MQSSKDVLSEWLPLWEQNNWKVNHVPIWARGKWEHILGIAKNHYIFVRWVATHQDNDTLSHQFNNQVDSLTCLALLAEEMENESWEHLLEWLHVKEGHSEIKDLLREASSQGWPVNKEQCSVITACGGCHIWFDWHPLQNPPLHLREGKGLWDVWQVDYIGPFKSPNRKTYLLVGIEIIYGLTQDATVSKATGENIIKNLQLWFSCLPKPKSTQSDNGSHFAAKAVQDWAKAKGIQWIFHTPYYPQANGIVERTNGLLKQFLNPLEPGWADRIWDAVTKKND